MVHAAKGLGWLRNRASYLTLTTETIDLLFHKFSLLRECSKTSILDSFVVDPKPKRKKGLCF